MKKSALTAAISLFAFAALSSCSGGSGDNVIPEASSKGPQQGLTNIRCYNLDSVSVNYTLVEKLNAEAEEAMAKYQNIERQRGNELQSMGQKIQNKLQNNGYLTEQSYNADMQSFQQKQQQVQNQLADLQNQLAQQAAAQQQQLLDSINNFLKAYNAVNHFDAILVQSPGSFYDESLDITDEIIKGLNARYKGEAAPIAAETEEKAENTVDKK